MTTNTPNRGYTYPQSSDHDRIWEHFQELATDIDTDVQALASADFPVVKLVQTVAQTLPHNTGTAITFTTETIDTNGSFNTGGSTTRVTPTKAGIYRLRGSISMASSTTYTVVQAYFRLNGSTAIAPGGRLGGLAMQTAPASGPSGVTGTVFTECLAALNGTTDYIELLGQQANTGTSAQNTNVSSPNSSVLELEYVRP
jgi:hypothetical protein